MSSDILVFDTTPLRHFAMINSLAVLKSVVGERTALVPDMVVTELEAAAHHHPEVRAAVDARWIEQRVLDAADDGYARFSAGLVVGDRNRGEAAVLALAQSVGGTAVIDDRAGRKAALRHGIALTGTLGLLVQAITSDPPLLTVALVSDLVDDLIANNYYIDIEPGGFPKWAADNGLQLPE